MPQRFIQIQTQLPLERSPFNAMLETQAEELLSKRIVVAIDAWYAFLSGRVNFASESTLVNFASHGYRAETLL